jgi:hypothetical protein
MKINKARKATTEVADRRKDDILDKERECLWRSDLLVQHHYKNKVDDGYKKT